MYVWKSIIRSMMYNCGLWRHNSIYSIGYQLLSFIHYHQYKNPKEIPTSTFACGNIAWALSHCKEHTTKHNKIKGPTKWRLHNTLLQIVLWDCCWNGALKLRMWIKNLLFITKIMLFRWSDIKVTNRPIKMNLLMSLQSWINKILFWSTVLLKHISLWDNFCHLLLHDLISNMVQLRFNLTLASSVLWSTSI